MPNLGSFNPFPALSNLQALQQLSTRSPPAATLSHSQSTIKTFNENQNTSVASPLDLSSSNTPPLAKRIKLSPTSMDINANQQQQSHSTKSLKANANSNQFTTLSSGLSTSSTGSNSTASNNSEQANATAQSVQKCQMKIDQINAWNVDEVCTFVDHIPICTEYVKVSF
jgi:hypothetical protein